ncbi:hypothetical protein ACFL59_13675, partial [Planctomycetota bacterium]
HSDAAEFWYEDNNMAVAAGIPADFKDKFLDPATWTESGDYLHVYLIRANTMLKTSNGLDDEFLRTKFVPLLNESGIAIALDVQGAVMMQKGVGRARMAKEVDLVQKLRDFGGTVTHVSLQSVLSKVFMVDGQPLSYPMGQRIADAIEYATVMNGQFPDMRIGITDALPTNGLDYETPYTLLAQGLQAVGLELSHIHLDCPYEYPQEGILGMSWPKVRQVEQFVRVLVGCDFGLVCTSRTGGYESDQAYHTNVLASWSQYRAFAGNPDHTVIMSWFPHPQLTTPETASGAQYPAMRTVVEFGRQLAATGDLDRPGKPVTSGLPPVYALEDGDDLVIDLRGHFSDPQDGSDLAYSLQRNTNAALVFCAVDEVTDDLTLSFTAGHSGTADVTIRAEDVSGAFVATTFLVTVEPLPPGIPEPSTWMLLALSISLLAVGVLR